MSNQASAVGRKLKVLYVCPLAHLGGHPYHASITETEALVEAGLDVTLLTFTGLIEGGLNSLVNEVSVLEPTKARARRFLTLNENPKTAQVLRSIAFLLTLLMVPALKKRLNYDVIHLRDGTGLFMSLPQLLGLVFRRSNWVISLLTSEEYPSLKGGLVRSTKGRLLYRLSLSRSKYAYLCQNQMLRNYYARRFLEGLLGDRVRVLPPAVRESKGDEMPTSMEIAKSQLGIAKDRILFLSFGALHPAKDIETVVSALRSFPNLVLVHAGTTNQRRVGTPQDLEAGRIIVSNRFIQDDEKQRYFSAASCVVLSYTKDFSGTASMLWEACRFRVPVIASDNQQLADLVTQFKVGLVFRAQDSESLKNAISHFLSLSPQELEEMKENCERFAKTYSTDEWARQCIEIYESL